MLAEHLQARDRDAPAISADGRAWVSVGELLRRAATAAGSGTSDDPIDAVAGLIGAQLAGRTPLVLPPGTVAPPLPPAPEPVLALATSGTTSSPRVVIRTAASWDLALQPFSDVTGRLPDDVAWAPGLPSSTLTLWAIHSALATGTPVVATGRRHDAVAALHDVTVVHTVPAVLADVLDARDAGGLPRLRRAVVAGAALPGALRVRAARLGVRVVEYYGAAELSFVAVDADGTGLRAFPGVELRVREGMVEVRSPYVALGYAHGSGPLRVVDGWAGVGDHGRLRADGVLVLDGRGDHALSVGGTTVLAGDVERVLGGVDGVLEVACLGEPHPRLGERPVAAVRLAPGVDRGRVVTELRAIARRDLPPPARPVRYAVLDGLPRTDGGKTDRAVLRRILARTR